MASKDKIPVSEIFGPTIMGEGLFAGMPTVFLRTAACDYYDVCLKCDSMHAVDPNKFTGVAKTMTSIEVVARLMEQIGETGCEWVTISGGNPALWDLSDVVTALHAREINVCVETQGSIFKTWLCDCDVVHIAPKGPGMVANAILSRSVFEDFMDKYTRCLDPARVLTCIKIPIFGAPDLDFAESIAEAWPVFNMSLSVGNNHPPGDGIGDSFVQSAVMLSYRRIIEEVLKRPKLMHATILPQLHVLVYGNKQGV